MNPQAFRPAQKLTGEGRVRWGKEGGNGLLLFGSCDLAKGREVHYSILFTPFRRSIGGGCGERVCWD